MKNIGEKIRKGVSMVLTTAMIAGLGYGLSTSRVSLKPNQGVILRELQNVNNVLEVTPRAIENTTNSKKSFWKQPYLPFKIGSIEAYIDLNEVKKIDGTFGFWTADKISGKEIDENYVRAFNFNFDTKIENLDSWARWDPAKYYGSSIVSSDAIESREEGLSKIVESLYLNGIRDQYGNYTTNKEGEIEFMGLINQINIWYAELTARHDFLIEKLGEEGLLEEMNKDKIKEYVNNLFEKEPWLVLGPLKLQSEGINMMREHEKYYFAQYPWYTYGMFYNNYSAESKQEILNSLFGLNPPKDMMKSQENREKEFEERLYRDYPKGKELTEKIEDIIEYEGKLNLTKVMEKGVNNYKEAIEKVLEKYNFSENDLKAIELIKEGVKEIDKETLEKMSERLCNCPDVENQVATELQRLVIGYSQKQFQTAIHAYQNDRLNFEIGEISNALSELEKTITEESRKISNEITTGFLKSLKEKAGYELEELGIQGLQQTLGIYLQEKGQEFMVKNQEAINHAWANLILEQRNRILDISDMALKELEEKEVSKWMYDGMIAYTKRFGIEPKDIDETNLKTLVQEYANSINNHLSHTIDTLNIDLHEYKIENDRNKAEEIRKELGDYFDGHLAQKREKEMRLWDYALEEIIANNPEKLDKSKEEDMEKLKEIRDKYVYKFIEKEAPEYFKEFMEKFHKLPYEESLGVVISNPELKIENKELFKGGAINREYENVVKQKQKSE